MSAINKLFRNPFYALAIIAGLMFTMTTCADVVLMMKTNRAGTSPQPGEPGFSLLDLLDRHGTEILAGLAEMARQRGCERLRLRVFDENPARRLYLRFGFFEVQRDGEAAWLEKTLA